MVKKAVGKKAEVEENAVEEDKESPEEAKKKEKSVEKELLKILIFLGVLVVIFLVASSFFRGFNTFEYQGLTFTQESLGEIPIYHYYYYFDDRGEVIKYNLYVRTDPRTLEVPIEGDDLLFGRGKRIYVTVDSKDLQECKNSILSIADLSRFLTDNQFNVKGGTPNFWEAGEKGVEHITCEIKPRNVVVVVQAGDETSVNIEGNCHTITIANCEILEATDAYKIQSIVDAKKVDAGRSLTPDL